MHLYAYSYIKTISSLIAAVEIYKDIQRIVVKLHVGEDD